MNRYVMFLVLLSSFIDPSMAETKDEEDPKCHLYIDQSGWIADNVDSYVKATYSSENICETLYLNYPCYSYYESKEGCTVTDQSLIDIFKRDARASGELVD